jgi:hypothetical protein
LQKLEKEGFHFSDQNLCLIVDSKSAVAKVVHNGERPIFSTSCFNFYGYYGIERLRENISA